MKNLYFIFLLSALFFSQSCGEKNQIDELSGIEYDKFVLNSDKFGDDLITITYSESGILHDDNLDIILSYINSLHKIEVDEVVYSNISFVNDNQLNLELHLRDSDEDINIPYAFVLKKQLNNQNQDLKTGTVAETDVYDVNETHTCTGSPCGCCSFLKNYSGSIVGCKCDGDYWLNSVCDHQVGQKCNHTVTAGGN